MGCQGRLSLLQVHHLSGRELPSPERVLCSWTVLSEHRISIFSCNPYSSELRGGTPILLVSVQLEARWSYRC